jgi:CheY-like chemotaxis protein
MAGHATEARLSKSIGSRRWTASGTMGALGARKRAVMLLRDDGTERDELEDVGAGFAPLASRRASASRPARLPSVLLVDDDLAHGAQLRAQLSKSCEVTLVNDAVTALEHLGAGHRYDLVLCDLVMRHLTGPEFFKRARWTAREMVPRIAFMARAVPESAVAFLRRTPNRCLPKPTDAATVLELLHAVRNARAAPATA